MRNISSEIVRYSFVKFVFSPESKINSSGKSQKSHVIMTFLSPKTFASEDSIFTKSLLKKISRASNIVDLPMSFLPINVVKLSNSMHTSSL